MIFIKRRFFLSCLLAFVQEKFKRILGVLNFGCLSDMLHYLLAYGTTLNLQVSTSMLITLECEFLLPLLGVLFRTGVEKKRGTFHIKIQARKQPLPLEDGGTYLHICQLIGEGHVERILSISSFSKPFVLSLNIKNKQGFWHMDVTQDFLNQIFAAKSKDLNYSYTDRKEI